MIAALLASTAGVTPLRVLGLQVQCTPGAVEANCAAAADLIRDNPGHRLYVLPELSATGYFDSVLGALDEYAQPADGSIATFFGDVAREARAFVCYGFLRRVGERTTICQAVAGPDGSQVLAYDKMHLCDMGACSEVGYGCSRGDALGTFEVDGVRVGLSICYDIRFPELFRRLAWDEGCDLVLHPSAFIRDATFPCYHQMCTVRAVENGIYFLSVNHGGEDFGDSIAVPPWIGPVPGLGAELAPTSLGTETGVLPLTVDPAALEAVRASYPYRRDVNPLLRPTNAREGRALDWSSVQGGGTKIAEIRRARRADEEADAQTRLANVGAALARAPPATLALVAVFVLLTFFDVFFNISRTFICDIPGGFCDPVQVDLG